MIDLTLVAVVDAGYVPEENLRSQIERVARGGATCLQIRAKELATKVWIRYGREAGEAARSAGLPFLINDRVDVALLVGADGVHLGAEDLPLPDARSLLGPGALVGATVRSAQAARRAEQEGADYLGVGPLFASPTKRRLAPLPHDQIRRIREATELPLVAIGGIDAGRAAAAASLGFDGVAVISALWQSADPEGASRELAGRFRQGRGS